MKDHLNKIDDYILGRLSSVERDKMDLELKNNPEMTLQLNERKLILEGIEANGEADLKNQLKSIHQEFLKEDEHSKPKPPKSIKKILLLLAAIVCASLAYYFYNKETKANIQSPELLYAKYYKAYDFSSGSRSSTQDLKFSEAVKYYNKNNFKEAVNLLEPIVQSDPQNSEYAFALALNTLYFDQETGKNLLERIIINDDPLFKDQAIWYLGLEELKQKNINKAKEYFQLLAADSNADNHLESKMILEKLK